MTTSSGEERRGGRGRERCGREGALRERGGGRERRELLLFGRTQPKGPPETARESHNRSGRVAGLLCAGEATVAVG